MISKISSSSDDGNDSISFSGPLNPRSTSSGQSSQHKLLNHKYSDEEVNQFFSSLGLGYFNNMTQDHLYTITLLRTYHPSSNIRRDGVRHVFEFARELELNQNLRRAAGEYANMPLYTELVRWIKDVHVKGMQFSTNTRGFKPSSTPSLSSVTPFSPKTPSLELAATGVEAVDKQGAGTVKPKRGPPPPTGPIATGPYDDEITRDRNLYCSDGFLYIATKKQCENCTHSPRCFNRRCRKCTLYGHRDEQCAQRVRDSSKSTDVTGKH